MSILSPLSLFCMAPIVVLSSYANEPLELKRDYNQDQQLTYGIWVNPQLGEGAGAKLLKELGTIAYPVQLLAEHEKNIADICIESRKELSATAVAKILKSQYGQGQEPHYAQLFKYGEGYVSYRIPSLISLPSGRLIAFAEARNWTHSDIAENDIVYRISDDGGKTWQAQQLLHEEGDSSLNNPTAIYLPEQKRIMMMYQSYPAKTHEGVDLKGRMKVYITQSDDEGKTWSKPRNIADSVFHPEANTVCCGPGIAIQLTEGPHKGRIVVPFNALGSRKWFNYLVYSDDVGTSWKVAEGTSQYGGNESQVVQSGPSELLIATRIHRLIDDKGELPRAAWGPWAFTKNERKRGFIRVSMDDENGFSWGDIEARADIPDPLCQGSILRLNGEMLLLSNPANALTITNPSKGFAATPPARINGTVRLSLDRGKTWSYSQRIMGDYCTHFGYSVLCSMGQGRLGCLFESNDNITFASFDLEWLTSGAISNDAQPKK